MPRFPPFVNFFGDFSTDPPFFEQKQVILGKSAPLFCLFAFFAGASLHLNQREDFVSMTFILQFYLKKVKKEIEKLAASATARANAGLP